MYESKEKKKGNFFIVYCIMFKLLITRVPLEFILMSRDLSTRCERSRQALALTFIRRLLGK